MKNRQDCGILIKQIHDAQEKQANNALRAQDLTMSQVNVLIELRMAANGQMSLKELERKLHVAQSTVAGLASRLEQKGFLEGFSSPQDRRVKMVRITDAGLETCSMADQQVRDAEEKLLSGMNEEERDCFHLLLERAARNLE